MISAEYQLFAKLWKRLLASPYFLVCPSVPTEQLGPHWMHFHKIWHLKVFFRKFVEKIQVLFKSDKNDGYFTWRPTHTFWSQIAKSILKWEIFRKKVVQNIKTRILCSKTSFQKSRPLWYVKKIFHSQTGHRWLWQRMCTPCWIPKATDTPSEYVILISFLRQQLLHERAWMLRYTYIACLVFHLKVFILPTTAPQFRYPLESATCGGHPPPLPPAVSTPLLLPTRGFIPSLLKLHACLDMPPDLWDALTFLATQ